MKTFNELIQDIKIIETDTGDIATVPSRIGLVQKRIELNKPEDLEHMFKGGKYVGMRVKNGDRLHKHFKDQGINMLDPGELHTTIAYSRKNFPHKINEDDNSGEIVVPPKDILGFELFGDDDNILVMTFKSKALQDKHNTTLENGAQYDYNAYVPHITLDYNYDINKHSIPKNNFKLPTFPIILHEEYVEPLDETYGE